MAKRVLARAQASLAVAMLAALLGVGPGCGTSAKLPPASDDSGRSPPSASAGSGFGSPADAGAPTCAKNPDGTTCDCVDVPLFTDPPNIYFVLDRSGSMAEDDRWDAVRITVGAIMRSLGPRANFGATVFPGFGDEMCAQPEEVLVTRAGDPPSKGDGPTTTQLLTATAGPPGGGTPTAAALRSVLPKLKALDGKSFVLLATDGGPNCNDTAACTVDMCQPNIDAQPGCPTGGPHNCCVPPEGSPASCLDRDETIAAVQALADANVPVYVIGIPGSAPYASLLDELATVGKTAQTSAPKYFAVDTSGQSSLLATLKKVAAKIVATCTFALGATPPDPELVNVYLDDAVLPRDPVDGWSLTNNEVTLLGDACDRVMTGDVLGVRIVTGCPTVVPK